MVRHKVKHFHMLDVENPVGAKSYLRPFGARQSSLLTGHPTGFANLHWRLTAYVHTIDWMVQIIEWVHADAGCAQMQRTTVVDLLGS